MPPRPCWDPNALAALGPAQPSHVWVPAIVFPGTPDRSLENAGMLFVLFLGHEFPGPLKLSTAGVRRHAIMWLADHSATRDCPSLAQDWPPPTQPRMARHHDFS